MKPQKDMIWKITVETIDGQIEEFETDGHIGKYLSFIKEYCKDILKSSYKRTIERWQEPIKKEEQ